MRRSALHIVVAVLLVSALYGCNGGGRQPKAPEEDTATKAMLEGIWVDAEEDVVVFKIKGDTIFYPDSAIQPVAFKILQDTMVLFGNTMSKYPIVRKDRHLFEFKNQANDIVKLIKSDDPYDSLDFVRHHPIVLNQGKTIKRDSVVSFSDNRYHCYVQVNPTTYKVYRSFYNAEGMEIENIYYDNIIHISIFSGANRLFSKNFRKADFAATVPKNVLKQCVLSDIKLVSLEDDGFHYQTQLAIPDSPSSFIVELIVSYKGKISIKPFGK